MANNKIFIKRTGTSGTRPTTTNISNAELAINVTDGILFSTNGSTIFEIGANNTNSTVSNTLTVGNGSSNGKISANGSTGTAGQVLTSGGSANNIFWRSVNSVSYAWSQTQTFDSEVTFNQDIKIDEARRIEFKDDDGNYLRLQSVDVQDFGSSKDILIPNRSGTIFVSGSSANLAALVSDETGTGNLVFSDNANLGGTTNVTALRVVSTITANGSVGTATHVLKSGGSGSNVYWEAVSGGAGTVTSVGSGDGLSGGPITSTGTLTVTGANGISVTAQGVNVNPNNGITVNASGVFAKSANGTSVDASGINVVGANGISVTAQGVNVNPNNGITVNASGVFAKSANGTSVDASGINVTPNNGITVNSTGVWAKSANGTSVDASGINVTPNNGIIVNTTGVHIDTSIVATLSGTQEFTNKSFSSSGFKIKTVAGGNATFLATSCTSNYSIVFPDRSGTAFVTGTSSDLAGLVSDETGTGNLVFSDNANLGGTTNVNALRVVSTITANGSVGTATHVLKSGGSGSNVYWEAESGGTFSNGIAYDWSAVQTFNANVAFSNTRISANGSFGSAGQFLTSSGTGANVYWTSVNSSSYSWNSEQTFNNTVIMIYGKTIEFADFYGSRIKLKTPDGVNDFGENRDIILPNRSGTIFVSGSSANLAALVSDETGTGSLVFSDNANLGGTTNVNALRVVSTITANGSVGTATHVLKSGGSGSNVYWEAVSGGTGTVTSITMGNGLSSTQSPLTTSGTMSVTGANGISVTAQGVNVNPNNGITVNASGVFAKSANGTSVDASGINVVGANGITVNTTGVFAKSANGTSVTAAGINVTAGNNTIFVNASGVHVNTSALPADGVTQVSNGNGLSGGPITSTGTLTVTGANGISVTAQGVNVNPNNGITVNATGVWAKSANGTSVDASGINVVGGTGIISNTTGVHVNASVQIRPPVSTTTGLLTAADANKSLRVTSGVTVNTGVFTAGDIMVIYNDSASNITLTANTGVTMRLAGGTTTGNRTLAQRGIATIYFVSSTEVAVGGTGVT